MLAMSLIGNVVRDPELRKTEAGTDVCSFSVAINSRYNGKESTTYVRVSAFGNRALPCSQYLEKGSKVYVRGTPSAHAYTSRSSGEVVASIEIIANEVEFLSSRNGSRNNAPSANTETHNHGASNGFTETEGDDLPF